MAISWVVLTQGGRDPELAAALASIQEQSSPPEEVIVVVNGSARVDVPAGVQLIELDENLGVPGGRNVGARSACGEIVAFLDDDARLATADIADALESAFAADVCLAAVSMRVLDPVSGGTQRRHVPSLRKADPAATRYVTSFLGGASAFRRKAFDQVGGLPDEFFFALEETDLSWRVLDAGYRILYRGDLTVLHPLTPASRHADFVRLTARNRVWLARRRLPWVLAALYLANWTAITLARSRGWGSWRAHLDGLAEGFQRPAGQRDPMSWTTVQAMTRLGRPPVV